MGRSYPVWTATCVIWKIFFERHHFGARWRPPAGVACPMQPHAPTRCGLAAISERSGTAVKGLTLARREAMTDVADWPRATSGAREFKPTLQNRAMTKKTKADPVAPALEAGNAARGGRPRPAGQSRLRQSAGPSRLDGALSDRRGFPRSPLPLPLRTARHAHVGGA